VLRAEADCLAAVLVGAEVLADEAGDSAVRAEVGDAVADLAEDA
jgi:hypothetical protein